MSRRAPLTPRLLVLALLLVAAAAAAPHPAAAATCTAVERALGATTCAEPGPVPSLEPRETSRLWKELVARARPLSFAREQADCRPARIVFYAPTDWLRLLLDKHRKVTAAGLQDDLTALLLQAC